MQYPDGPVIGEHLPLDTLFPNLASFSYSEWERILNDGSATRPRSWRTYARHHWYLTQKWYDQSANDSQWQEPQWSICYERIGKGRLVSIHHFESIGSHLKYFMLIDMDGTGDHAFAENILLAKAVWTRYPGGFECDKPTQWSELPMRELHSIVTRNLIPAELYHYRDRYFASDLESRRTLGSIRMAR